MQMAWPNQIGRRVVARMLLDRSHPYLNRPFLSMLVVGVEVVESRLQLLVFVPPLFVDPNLVQRVLEGRIERSNYSSY